MISLDSKSQAKLVWIGALLAPAIAVQGVRFLADAELSGAAAATPAQPAAQLIVAPVATPLSPQQRAALDWLKQLPTVADRSPMEKPRMPLPEPTPDHAGEPEAPARPRIEPPAPGDDRPHHLKLSGMIGSDSDALAAISGKLRRVGDEPAPGWIIQQIDSRNRVVVLKHADGRVFTISPPTPSIER